ncbi:RRFM protein, partial [Polyodon spathula]|nr:RRFM protein [Polyodon spathula]
MKSPQLILVNLTSFPEATAAATKAIRESGMNLNPEVDGAVVRVPIPKVTREHREKLAKLAKQFTNKAKESLRKVRTNAVNQAKRSKDTVSEDTIKLIEKQVKDGAWFMVSCSFLHWLYTVHTCIHKEGQGAYVYPDMLILTVTCAKECSEQVSSQNGFLAK